MIALKCNKLHATSEKYKRVLYVIEKNVCILHNIYTYVFTYMKCNLFHTRSKNAEKKSLKGHEKSLKGHKKSLKGHKKSEGCHSQDTWSFIRTPCVVS